MENWETWDGVGEHTFSCLHELSIINCPKLAKLSPLSLPSLCLLKLRGCKEVVFRSLRDLTSVTSLTIDNISELVCLGDEFNQQLESLETLEIFNCGELRCLWKKTEDHHPKGLTHLRRIEIRRCDVLEYFGAEEKEEGHLGLFNSPLVELSALVELQIDRCESFVSFAGMRCPSLRHLEVTCCDTLEGLPEGIISPRESESGSNICPLEHLNIEDCNKLEALPEGIMNTCGLEELSLVKCGSLKHFPAGELPVSLKTLFIKDCPQMGSIAEWKMIPNNICLEKLAIYFNGYSKILPECTLVNLTKLDIFNCEGIESFWEGVFLAPNLKDLSLRGCNNLRCITDQIQSLTSLEDLQIWGCRGFERFPDAGFPTTLLSLHIEDCGGLERFPGFPTTLISLYIRRCIRLEKFPEAGFPITLLSLHIGHCKNVKQRISEWGLHKLTSLKELTINEVCPDTVTFGEDFTLPSSLSSLEIINFPNLDSLSPRLSQSLTSLQTLCLRCCPKLQSFPKELLSLPQFSELWIIFCPNLKRLCQEEKGEYWSHISLLPKVCIRLNVYTN